MTKALPGWAVEVSGAQVDLNDALAVFGNGYRLTISPYDRDGETVFLLRNGNWWHLDSAGEVMADAEQIVRELNGALLLTYGDSKPLKTGGIMRWDANGIEMRIVVAVSAEIKLDGFRARGTLTTGGADGSPSLPPGRAWMDQADASDLMSDLLVHIGRASDWFDLFKAIELVQEIFSVDTMQREMGRKRWWLWESARMCANFRRHSKVQQKPVREPNLTFRTARSRVVCDIGFILGRVACEP